MLIAGIVCRMYKFSTDVTDVTDSGDELFNPGVELFKLEFELFKPEFELLRNSSEPLKSICGENSFKSV
jgi:hypothetical protein